MDNNECQYCKAPELFSLLPAELYTFVNHNREEVTLWMHREINGVKDSAGIECQARNSQPD